MSSTEDTTVANNKANIELPGDDFLWDQIQIRAHASEDSLLFFQFPVVLPRFENPPPVPEPMNVEPGGTKAENSATAAKDAAESAAAASVTASSPLLLSSSSKPTGTAIATPGAVHKQEDGKGKGKALAATVIKIEDEIGGAAEEKAAEADVEGCVGKLMVYKSGKVKMKMGDLLLDVHTGSDCSFLQNVVAVDAQNKQAFVMGTIAKRFVCIPDIGSLLK